MEVKKMNLGRSPSHEAGGSKIMDFALGKGRLAKLESVIEESSQLEFWSPKYQAWRKLLELYLSSGNNPALAKSYLLPLLKKEDWIAVPDCPATPIYHDVMRLKNTSGSELFQDIYFTSIQEFCQVYCQFFISQRKRLLREMHTEGVCMDVMSQLLNRGTYRSLMCAAILYREDQPIGFDFPSEIEEQISERLHSWAQEFNQEFLGIQELLGGLSQQYNWYCDTVREAIVAAWDVGLIRSNRPNLVSVAAQRALSKDCADDLLGYISASPVGIGPNMQGTAAFDAMYQIFYNNVADDPDNAERAFFALCIPESKFKTMVDYLYDFYWCVADGLLSSALYARIVVAFQKNKDSTDPRDYLASLMYRGYPELK